MLVDFDPNFTGIVLLLNKKAVRNEVTYLLKTTK